MFGRPIPRARPGRPDVAGVIAQLSDRIAQNGRNRSTPSLPVIEAAGSPLRRKARPPSFMAKLTMAGSANPYSYSEVYGVNTGALWATYPGGRSGSNAYELNNQSVAYGSVVELHPVGGGAWYWFVWKSKPSSGGGGGGGGTVAMCYCDAVPVTLTMTSASTTCNYGMFQNATLQYQTVPSAYAALELGSEAFISLESFHDTLAESLNPSFGPIIFQYYLECMDNEFFLSRIYASNPEGSPYRDGYLYTWFVGAFGNTCSPFHLDNGTAYPGSDASCSVTIDG